MKKDEITKEHVQDFHDHLMGQNPHEGMVIKNGNRPKMSAEKAFHIIWYLQEQLRIIPDNFEMCNSCKNIYDTHREGHHCEECEKFFCDSCLRYCKHYYGNE